MSTINEVFAEAENEVEEQYNSSHRKEIITAVHGLVDLLNWKSVWDQPAKEFQFYSVDELTRIGWRLAIYQYNLIEYELEAYKNTKKAECAIDSNKYTIRKKIIAESEKKPNETDIRARTDSLLVKFNIIKELHEVEHNRLTAMKFSINTINNRLESRIKYLLSDINQKFKNEE
mgnify:CR=1 FL=1